MDKYRVLARIWHTGDGCYYETDANVTMTHLADFQIKRLIAQGVIEPVEKPKRKKREVKQHGNTDNTGNDHSGDNTNVDISRGGR